MNLPLTKEEKALIIQYSNRINSLREAMNDVLSVMLFSRGLSLEDYIVDLQKLEIVAREKNEQTKEQIC